MASSRAGLLRGPLMHQTEGQVRAHLQPNALPPAAGDGQSSCHSAAAPSPSASSRCINRAGASKMAELLPAGCSPPALRRPGRPPRPRGKGQRLQHGP